MFSIILLLLITESAVASTIQMSDYSVIPAKDCPSTSALLNGKSYYTYTFKVDTSSADISIRRLVRYEVELPETSTLKLICSVNIYSENCTSNQNRTCYCSNKVNSVYEIVMNDTANLNYSNAPIRLVYPITPSTFDASDFSNMSVVYDAADESLQINKKDFLKGDLSNVLCNITDENSVEINWCVKNLDKNHTLEILSSAGNKSGANCVSNTFGPNGPVSINLTYSEPGGCQRRRSYFCYLNVQSTTHPNSCSNAGIGVISAHVICTVFIIILSIIALLLILKNNGFETYLIIIILVSETIFEIAQIILVVVAATRIDCNLDTSIPFWIIMIIYQCLVNFIFIVVDCILLGIRKKCLTPHQLKVLVALLCVHTVIGVILLPFIYFFLCTKESVDIKGENHSLRDDPVHSNVAASHRENKKPATACTVTLSPDEVKSPNSLIKNDQDKTTTIGNEKISDTIIKQNKKNRSKKNRNKPVNSAGKDSTGTTERIETASDININVEDSSNENKKVSNVTGINTNSSLWAGKRPPSIEITSNSLRELPPLRKNNIP